MLARLEQPYRLIVETCIATGARISEALGLMWKHVDFEAGTIRIEQRVWRQELGRPKTESSRRTLGLGDLVAHYRERAAADGARPEEFGGHGTGDLRGSVTIRRRERITRAQETRLRVPFASA
ncbi:MAG: tyrosine-type recombinase/integrase [Acidobacteria bacterium]|nr:tyrosine-type recombinase/integrase [Acidobacteriota bacterium]